MGLFNFSKKEKKSNNSMELSKTEVNFTDDGILPIQKRIENVEPTCDGLYPHEILVLSYAPLYCAKGENQFPGFWWYKYGISDITDILKDLMKKGLVQEGTTKDAAKKEKASVIKDELKKNGLKMSGKKDELIERLFESVSEEELSRIFIRLPYKLTELGEEKLKKFEWIPFIHAHTIEDLDIWNLTELVQSPPFSKYRDKIWGYLNNRGGLHMRNRDYGLYRNSRLAMSDFVASEGKKDIAFNLLCEVIAYDLSGLTNGFNMELLEIFSSNYFPYEDSIARMAPGITNKVKEYAKDLMWNDDELIQHLDEGIKKIELPFRLFSVEECVEIVLAELNEDLDVLESIYGKAETRFKKAYKK